MDHGISTIYITTDFQNQKLKSLIKAKYNNSLDLNFISSDGSKRPGYSFARGLNEIDERPVVVCHGDTIFLDGVSNSLGRDSIIFTANQESMLHQWCGVHSENSYVRSFQERSDNTRSSVMAGLFYVTDLTDLKEVDREISDVYEENFDLDNDSVKSVSLDSWFDVGHLNKYYESKKALLQTRSFNKITYDNDVGIISKTSTESDILRNEILWYTNLPDQLSILTPRLVDHKIDFPISLDLEYYGYPSLSEYWLYGNVSETVWETIIDKLFVFHDRFRSFKGTVSFGDYNEMYLEKTRKRINALRTESKNVYDLLEYETVVINGVEYSGWNQLNGLVSDYIENFYEEDDNSIIHGDFHFANCLFDLGSGILRLIDPRGKWGENIIHGDSKYDAAKLRHSCSGKYDFIVNDMFDFRQNENEFTCSFKLFKPLHEHVSEYLDRKISERYNLNDIIFIEGLLFISMIPLHSDNERRQKMMFLTAIERLNRVLQK